MECLQIDWKNIDGTFEKDDFYENIQAPKWIDFTVPLQPVDDHGWFCGKTVLAGCTHQTKAVLQASNQSSIAPIAVPMTSANTEDLLAAKTVSAGVAGKKKRPVVSSSLSSLSDLKAAYAKKKVLHHTQMPSIGENKGATAKSNRWQQASENENPNRACNKVQDGACKKPPPRVLEDIARQMKVSESKGIVGKGASANVPNRDTSMRSVKTLSEQVGLSQSGPVLEASKPVFIFGKRDPMHAKSTLNKGIDKETPFVSKSITKAETVKGGGTRFFSRPSPTARNPYLSASLAMPIVRRSAAGARPLHGVYLGNDKVVECKPPRVTRDVRVTVQANASKKKNDHKKDALVGKLQERDAQKDTDLQEESKADNVEEERKSDDIQTREKEDSLTNTLEKFLENLQITSHEDESVSNKELSGDCVTEKILLNEETAVTHHIEPAMGHDSAGTYQHVDNEMVISKHSDDATGRNSVQSCSEENVMQHDSKHNVLEKEAGCLHHGVELLQTSEPLSSKDKGNPSSAALLTSSDGAQAKNEVLSPEEDKRPKNTQQKQNLQLTKNWQGHRGTKRKSSELNLNCSSKDHKCETQKQSKQSVSTAKPPLIPASQPHGLQDSSEDQHKRLKTTLQAFKPFRFRTEERGALKELGLSKKEPEVPKSKEMVHHALQMPSFSRPFIPQRSTKKLTIPREPKFHVSRTKNASATLATGLIS